MGRSFSDYDESDVRVRPGKGSRPRSKQRPAHHDAEFGLVVAKDRGRWGVVLDTGNPHYLEFYKRQGYEEIGEVAVGPIREHVFFHPNPQPAQQASA